MVEDLTKINGKEIIDFLNEVTTRDDDALEDISMEGGGFVFESQGIKDGVYTLYFTASYNNWGTSQDIFGNQLKTDCKKAWFHLEEPFDGDGTDDDLAEVLIPWLKNHTFLDNKQEQFLVCIALAHADLREVTFENNAALEGIIAKLVEAQTWV